ncbi:hypothetical protein N7467_009922 [Penicillium canescens]|nr:hypothetical protein N7467_009922 [Penicillium canescens]
MPIFETYAATTSFLSAPGSAKPPFYLVRQMTRSHLTLSTSKGTWKAASDSMERELVNEIIKRACHAVAVHVGV